MIIKQNAVLEWQFKWSIIEHPDFGGKGVPYFWGITVYPKTAPTEKMILFSTLCLF